MTETKIIETRTHGRYLVKRGESNRLLIGFHGYGENAERHLAELEKLDVDWTLVAIQALNRFYTRSEEIVANWMTREDRELAIDDNIHYVHRVVEELGPHERLVFAGFSQGAAMAYRAAASIDLEHDAADLGTKVTCPMLALWGAKGRIAQMFDVLATWRERATDVGGRALPCGHYVPEEAPEETFRELLAFFRGRAA